MAMIRMRRVLSNEGADSVVDAAVAFAKGKGRRVVVAIVDPAGELIELRRTPGAQVASSRVAVDKARTAAIFVRPSRALEEQVSRGRLGALALHGAAALTGGIPLTVDSEVVGAIGTSGETPDEDEEVSLAGARVPFATNQVAALTYEGARFVAESSGSVARMRGVAPVVSVVDAAGELVYLWRPDGAQVASVSVSSDKARTAAIYRRPSKDFETQASSGRPSALQLARAVPLQGGIPLLVGEEVVGAIGVSGASSADEDQELALIGAAAFSKAGGRTGAANGADYFSRQELEKKFEVGGLLLDASGYKLDAGRREQPGEVEFHQHIADVMHVVEGQATVITGGTMVDSREVSPGELRARSINGGRRHALHKGDVLAIPSGVPHEFIEVSDPFLYFVVKVEA